MQELDPLLKYDIQIAAHEIKRTPGDWKAKLYSAWEFVDENSLNSNRGGPSWDEHRLKAGVGGLLLFLGRDTPEYKRVVLEMKMLGRFSAMLTAAQQGFEVGLSDVFEGVDEKYEAIGILGWFKEWKEQHAKMRDPNWRRASRLAGELIGHCREHNITGTFHGVTITEQQLKGVS